MLSARLQQGIRTEIEESGGWLGFARYMELALYAPGLGYYSAGSAKLGAAGDFVTAPELSPLFGRCLASQVAAVIGLGIPDVIEVGAGSGILAAQLLRALEMLGALPHRYFILEVSADLRLRQRERMAREVPHLAGRVQWLEVLPEKLDAVLIANEVLDAIPTHRVCVHQDRIDEIGVGLSPGDQTFVRSDRAASGRLLAIAAALGLPDGHETEINPAARAFVKSFASSIARGAMFFIDYGYPAREYYDARRSSGTLRCHYRHHAHDDPFVLVGLQDITSHVDFTAVADAAISAGMTVLGYTTQAHFLIGADITRILAETSPEDVLAYVPLASQAQKLLSPSEMGERFKVIALGRGIDPVLPGFAQGDRTHTL